MTIQDINQTLISDVCVDIALGRTWKSLLVVFAVTLTYVCLGACTLILHMINYYFLFNRLLPLYELISTFHSDLSSTFFYSNYVVDILIRCSKLLLE